MTGRASGEQDRRWSLWFGIVVVLWGALAAASATAQAPLPPGTVDIIEDIRVTRHNLSILGKGDVKSNAESEVCVFCHTPHGASSAGLAFEAPLWNRNLQYRDNQSYLLYDNAWSFTFDGPMSGSKPTGYSRLCLSCHDGVIALGTVINKPLSGGYMGDAPVAPGITVGGTSAGGKMPLGTGFRSDPLSPAPNPELSGDTRFLGTNLENDHPISFLFDTNLAIKDAELVDPGAPPTGLNDITNLAPGGGHKTGVKRYLGATNEFDSVQCTSCHNPHAVTYPKFLRGPRFQDASESGFLPEGAGGPTPSTGQIICLYCHAKPGWRGSTHDVDTAVRAAYPRVDDPATSFREDYDYDGLHTVGQIACRACHDPHTAQGAKRLHREGVTQLGAVDAVEATCYLCHSPNTAANPLLVAGDPTTPSNPRFNAGTRFAPDIYTDFAKDNPACRGGIGTGSAMCLQLSAGHNPIFISRPQEGVQLKSDGVALVPVQNEESPGITTPDSPHISCVDCHNVHQVNSPNNQSVAYSGVPNVNPPDAAGEGGRFRGMKGIGIDSTGTRPVIIGRCEPNFVICGKELTISANHPDMVNQASANRDPLVYEVCFRCHGNSYTNIWGPASGFQYRHPDDISILSVPPNYASYTAIAFSPRTDPTNGQTGDNFSFKGFSNKWKELNPYTPDIDTPAMLSADLARFGKPVFSHTQQTKNPAYHPVVLPARNGSVQICNQLSKALELDCGVGLQQPDADPNNPAHQATSRTSLGKRTIQCVDCHNSNNYDTFQNAYPNLFTSAFDDSPMRGPITESNLRPTDVWPNLNAIPGFNYLIDRPKKPIGPHGSIHRRILRANFDTDILRPGRCFEQNNPPGCLDGDGYSTGSTHSIAGGGQGSNDAHFQRFLLCFNCHDRRAFDPDVAASGGSSDQDPRWTRFFGVKGGVGVDSWWNGNLHMYHLRWTGAMCHECHYNVHSNVEAINTIFGDGTGGLLPGDGVDGMNDGVIATHLINFGPTVEGTTHKKPVWFFDGAAFRCYLRCHNEVMDSCAYQAQGTGTPNARWCAGGRNPGTSG